MAGPLNRSNRAISVSSDAPGLEAGSAPGLTAKATPRLVQTVWRVMGDGRIVFGLLAAILAGGLLVQMSSVINHDTAWYLYSGERFLEGGRLYRDIFVDVNPPLVLLLTLPATALARWLGVFPVDVFVVYGFVLIALSLAATARILRADQQLAPPMRRGFIVLAALAMTVCTMGEFGQREHLLIVLALPYLCLLALRASDVPVNRLLAAAAGGAAALGFALKPHFLLIPIGLEIYRAAVSKRVGALVRPETLSLAGVGLLYGAGVALLVPEYLDRIVPYALEVYNNAFRHPLWVVLFRPETLLVPIALVLCLRQRPAIHGLPLSGVMFVTAVCTFAAYTAQAKGWRYQLYPTTASLFLGFSYFALAQWRGRLRDCGPMYGRPWLPAAAAALTVVVLIATLIYRGGYHNRLMGTFLPYVEAQAPSQSILVLSSNVSAGFPMVNYSGVGWSSRFPTLWLLPGALLQRHATDGTDDMLLDEIERYTRNAVLADFTSHPPDLVIVDNREKKSYFGDLSVDYIDYFTEDPRFAAIWTSYEWVANEGDYRLYRRRCTAAC